MVRSHFDRRGCGALMMGLGLKGWFIGGRTANPTIPLG